MPVHEEVRARLGGDSLGVMELRARIERFANVPASVLIVGESGSGKEVVARYLHDVGPRRSSPFIAVNCAAIPHELAESQLFGHERGSFTGAVSQHTGFFEAASGGTLFLDEIQDMPMALQVKLLRALETHTVVRVGGYDPVSFDTRIIAATHASPGVPYARGACVRICSSASLRSRCMYRRCDGVKTMCLRSRKRTSIGSMRPAAPASALRRNR